MFILEKLGQGAIFWFFIVTHVFSGYIEFRNKSTKEVYVSELTGFSNRVGCGYLVGGGVAGMSFDPMCYPTESSLRWRTGKEADRVDSLSFASFRNRSRDALIVEFGEDCTWRAFFEPIK